MRDVLLMRHGRAVADAPGGDAMRELTPHGCTQAARIATQLKTAHLVPALIWHSPYLRTTQTAALLHASFGCAIHVVPALVPDASAARASAAVRVHLDSAAPARLLLVSHLPLLPALAAQLGVEFASFATAAVAHLAFDDAGGARLLRLYLPDDDDSLTP